MTGPELPASPGGTWLSWVLAASLAAVGLVFAASLEEEPYHIDELRQTRSYSGSLGFVIDSSFAQDQPPLDPVLNALVQRVIGEGDWQQRLLSAVSGLAGLALFAVLLRRADLGRGTPYAILVMGLAPLVVSVFVYARPYGLPFLLMVAFLLATDRWLHQQGRWVLLALFIIALLLPLSRTLEPNVALASVVVVLLVFRLTGRADRFQGSIWVPIGAALTSLIGVGLPVIARLRSQLTEYTEADVLPSGEQLIRLVTDLPSALARHLPAAPIALVVVILALARPGVRRKFATTWWAWVWLMVALGFSLLFLLTTNPDQPFFGRYLFTWIPLLALMVALLVSDARQPGIWDRIAIGSSAALVIATAALLVPALTSHDRGNWEALSRAIVESEPDVTAVVLESLGPLGDYRTPFAGQPRYLPQDWATVRVLDLIGDPTILPEDSRFTIAVLTEETSAPGPLGWQITRVDDFFSLYHPPGPKMGHAALAGHLLRLSEATDPDRGATLALAAASLLHHLGEDSEACDVLSSITNSEDLALRAMTVLEAQGSRLIGLDCPNAGSSSSTDDQP